LKEQLNNEISTIAAVLIIAAIELYSYSEYKSMAAIF